ncbi:MAG: right-handed parallel beta-helix repeat-containing protein [Chloroflexi bacterium]|nr:right-handed parallel beta-helix repeat-containing protein [Chloroflexota bacterium]
MTRSNYVQSRESAADFVQPKPRHTAKRLGYLGLVPLAALFVLTALLWFLGGGPSLAMAAPAAATYYAWPSGTNANACSSADPCSLTRAIELAIDGDEIRVASGSYSSAPGIPVMLVTESITITGGYLYNSGTGTWSSTPDPLNTTILDGGGNGRVVDISANINPIIENFHIQNGQAVNGAGIYIADGAGRAIIRHNFIHNNTASGGLGGGGIYDGGAATIAYNEIYDNQANPSGAGIYIHNNGAAITSTIRFNDIYNNTAASVNPAYGGGIFLFGNAKAEMVANNIYQNMADIGGGMAAFGAARFTMHSNMIYDNTAVGQGSGTAIGGAIYSLGNGTIWNNTIVGNTANDNGAGLFLELSSVAEIHNTIVAFNNGSNNDGVHNAAPAATTGSYNNIFDDATNVVFTNNVGGHPSFVNLGAFNLHLSGSSPLLNVGSPATPAWVNVDIDGQARPNPNHGAPPRHEVGADEYYPDFRQVSLNPPSTVEFVDRGTTAVYTHTVRNDGTLADTYDFTCSNDLWSVVCPGSVGLAPGQAASVATSVVIPADALAYAVGLTQITATSQISTAVFDRATVQSTVRPLPGLLFTPVFSRTELPGTTITLTHILTNTGDATDSFAVSIVDDPFGWAELIPQDPLTVTLGAGARQPVRVRITIPPYAQAGIVNLIAVEAHSTFDPAISATLVNTITAKATVGTRYVSPTGTNLNNNCTQPVANFAQDNPGPCQTISWAVGQASFNDEIHVAPGAYNEAEIFINDTIRLSGGWTAFNANGQGEEPDPTLTVISASGTRLLNIAAGSNIRPTIDTLTLQNGVSGGSGGAVLVGSLAQPTFNNVIFNNNQAAAQGGALYVNNNAAVTVRQSAFTNNTAQADGGAVYVAGGTFSLLETRFFTNTASGAAVGRGGGAVYVNSGVAAVQNNLFVNNTAVRDGGAVRFQGGQVFFVNNTLAENSAGSNGGGLYNNGASLSITNTILVSNTAQADGGALFVNAGQTSMDYSNVWQNGGASQSNIPIGVHSIAANPLFADDEYRLALGSPSIDVGDPATVLSIDFEGDFRPSDQGYDQGWDELAGCRAKRGSVIYGSIQDAVDANSPSTLIQVAGVCRGVHTLEVDGQVISQTVHLTQTVRIEGGWNGDFSQRNYEEPTIVDPEGRGRGFYFSGSAAPVIEALTIVNGNAAGLGGGPAAADAGGGLYNLDSSPVLSGVVVMSGTAELGGGFYNHLGAPVIQSRVLTGTQATSAKVALSEIMSSTAVAGGGLFNFGGSLVVDGARIHHNAAQDGGGIFNVTGTMTVANTIVDQNAASIWGGGLHDEGSATAYLHLTVISNTAVTAGGGFYSFLGAPVIRSSIFQGNQAPAGAAIFADGGAPDVDYNYYFGQIGPNVTGAVTGTHSIVSTTPPGLLDPASGNFHLSDEATAVDKGDPASPITRDFEGEIRPSNQGPDMGADELAGCSVSVNGVIYGSIQTAIDNAQAGDTIKVTGICRGVQTGGGTGSSVCGSAPGTLLVITKTVNLLGGWDEAFNAQVGYTVLDAQNAGRVIYVGQGVTPTINGFDIIRGSVSGANGNGAGICVDSAAPTISHNRFYSNTATNGGAIYAFDSGALIEAGNRLYHNTAATGAAIYLSSPDGITATVQNNFVYRNTAVNGGGLYNNSADNILRHNTIISNTASATGAAVYVAAGAPEIRGNIIMSHTTGTVGGVFGAPGAAPVMGNNNFFQNNADVGGSILTPGPGTLNVNPGFNLLVTDSFTLTIQSPVADVYLPDTPLATDYEGDIRPSHQLYDLGADEVGGCYAAIAGAESTVYGSVQTAVDAAEAGDTILINGLCQNVQGRVIDGALVTQTVAITKALTLDGSWVYKEPISATLDALNRGRVVYVGQTAVVTLTNITLINGDSTAAGDGDRGGALFNAGNTILVNTLITNSIGALGGGIFNGANLTLRQSRVLTNTAASGGGLYNDAAGGLALVQKSQFLGNLAFDGGAVYQQDGDLFLDGNKLHNNVVNDNGGAVFVTGGTGNNVDVRNNFIYFNLSGRGGGLYNAGTNGRFWHNTFVQNEATTLEGGGIYNAAGDGDIRSNILDRNLGTGVSVAAGSPRVEYNNAYNNFPDNYANVTPGVGSISQIPTYKDFLLADFHLDDGSAGEDQGDSRLSDPALNPLHLIDSDYDGDMRPTNGAPDIGADEINACLIKVGEQFFSVLQDAIDYAEATDQYQVLIGRGECRGVQTKNGTEQVGYVREDLHFIGSLPRETFNPASGDRKNPNILVVTTIINAIDEGRVIYVANNASPIFEQLAFVRGNAFNTDPASNNGGGIYNAGAGTVSFEVSDISQNTAVNGGGYYGGADGKADFTGMSIGLAFPSRGVRIEDGELYLNYVLYTGNVATSQGAGLYSSGTFDVRNANFRNNSAGESGGGVYNTATESRLVNATFYQNTAVNNGGGIFNSGAFFRLYHNTIRNNNAAGGSGGGVYNSGSGFLLSNSIVYSNTAASSPAGVRSSSGSLSYNNFHENQPGDFSAGLTNENAIIGDPGLVGIRNLSVHSRNIDAADPAFPTPVPPDDLIINYDYAVFFRPDGFEANIANLQPPHGLRSDVGVDEYLKDFGCQIEPPNDSASVAPGGVVTYTLEVINVGNESYIDLLNSGRSPYLSNGYTDTITITLNSSTQGWSELEGGSVQTVVLGWDDYALGAATSRILTVTVPASATVGLIEESVIRCESGSLPIDRASDTTILRTSTGPTSGVEVYPPPDGTAVPGQVLTFTQNVRNIGNETLSFSVTPNSGPRYANAALLDINTQEVVTNVVVTLAPTEVFTTLLRVTILDTAMAGDTARPGVVARSTVDPLNFGASSGTILILPGPGTRYVAADGAANNTNCTDPLSPCATIQHAIGQAVAGDSVLVSVGTYTDHTTRTIGLEPLVQNVFIDKSIAIVGGFNVADQYSMTTQFPITNAVILNGQNARRVIYVTEGVTATISNLFIQNGQAAPGSGVNGDTRDFGGGVYNAGANLTITGTWVLTNGARFGGGLYHADGDLTVNNSVFAANTNSNPSDAGGEGGGMYVVTGTAVLENNTFVNNRANPGDSGFFVGGGAIYLDGGQATVVNHIFQGNAASVGDAIYISNTASLANDYNLFFDQTTEPIGGNGALGAHDRTGDPVFVDGYYHIGFASAAKDQGTSDPALVSTAVLDGLDFDLEDRIQGAQIDIGADERTQKPGFVFLPTPLAATIDAGEVFTYFHTITNTGDFTDTYTLALTNTLIPPTALGWSASFSPATITDLPVGASVGVSLVITGGEPGSTAVSTLTAVSDSGLVRSVQDTTTVSQTAGVDIEASLTGSGLPGETVIYTHTLQNTGNGLDEFALTYTAVPTNWLVSLTPDQTGFLTPGGIMTFSVSVQIPAGTISGTQHQVVVTAAATNPDASDTLTNTTTVGLQANALTLTPDNERTVLDGVTVPYTHTLVNDSNTTEIVDLSVGSSRPDWSVSVLPGSVTLAPYGQTMVDVLVTVPVGAGGLVQTAVVTATGRATGLQDTAVNTTTVTANTGISLEPDLAQTADRGALVTYEHRLTNLGNLTDTISLTAVSQQGWLNSLTAGPFTLGAGEGVTVTAVISIPTDALPGTMDTLVITATSGIDANVFDTAVDTTRVAQNHSLAFFPDRSSTVDPGTTAVYTHTLHNTGDGVDTFILLPQSSQPWALDITPFTVTLAADEQTTVAVTLTVPVGASGLSNVTIITASSTISNVHQAAVTETTNVNGAVIELGVDIEPDRQGMGVPGETVQYQHTVTNTGTGPDDYSLTVTSSENWVVSVTPNQLRLGAGESAPVMVSVTISTTAAGGAVDTTQVYVTSDTDPTVFDVVTNTTRTPQTHSFTFVPDRTSTVDAGATAVYTHTLTNNGDGGEQFAITWSSSQPGWPLTVAPSAVFLVPGAQRTVTMTLLVPPGASGLVDVTTITATSTISPAFTAAVVNTTTVTGEQANLGVTIEADSAATGAPGATVQYIHTVTNIGEVADSYALTAVSASGWTAVANPPQITLAAGDSGQVTVSVTIAPAAAAGQVDLTTVTARSTTNSDIADSVVDTTTVEGAPPVTAVTIVPNHVGYGGPGASFAYVHTVSNNGDSADSYSLSLASSQSWGQAVSPATLALAAGASGQVTVTVSISAGAVPGARDVTLVTVQSQSDVSASATATDTTSYPAIYLPVIFKSPAVTPPPPPTFTPTPSPTPRVCGDPTGVDLVVTGIQVVPGTPGSGQAATVYVTIRNQGTVGVAYGNNFFLDFYVDRQPAPNQRGEIEWGVQGILMSAGHSETFSAPFTFSGGTHQLWAQVDSDDTVNECPFETNNRLGPVPLMVTGASGGEQPQVEPPVSDEPRYTPTPAPIMTPPATPTPAATPER